VHLPECTSATNKIFSPGQHRQHLLTYQGQLHLRNIDVLRTAHFLELNQQSRPVVLTITCLEQIASPLPSGGMQLLRNPFLSDSSSSIPLLFESLSRYKVVPYLLRRIPLASSEHYQVRYLYCTSVSYCSYMPCSTLRLVTINPIPCVCASASVTVCMLLASPYRCTW